MPITPSSSPLYTGQVRPPDVPAYVPQQIAYATGTNSPIVGDGTATGGFAPYWANQLADIPTANRLSWMDQSVVDLNNFLTTSDGGTFTEGKMRTHAETGAPCYADNIRYYGDTSRRSHLHSRFGNLTQNCHSTFSTLRTPIADDDDTGSAGGQNNATGYLMPALLFDKDGKTYHIAPGTVTIYYQQNPDLHDNIHPNPLGLRYVAGFDMDTPTRRAQLAAMANADNGGGIRYRPSSSVTTDPDTFHTWIANNTNGNEESDHLIGAGGSDPFNGALSVAAGGTELRLQMAQGLAWDGVNPWSPRGYDHVIPTLYDSLEDKSVAPEGWFILPTPQFNMGWDLVELETFLGGPIQNYNPRLSSDAHHGSLPGRTVHWDWTGAWDAQTLRNWEEFGIGCGLLGGVPHELNDSRVSANERLIVLEQAPNGKQPQVDFSRGIQIFEIPAGTAPVSTRLA